MAFSRTQRLNRSKVQEVFAATRPLREGGLTLRVHRVSGPAAYAVIVPVSVAPGAAKRNALRRRIVEALRTLTHGQNLTGVRVIITAGRSSETTEEIRAELVSLLSKSGILKQ